MPKKKKVPRTGGQEVAYLVKQYLIDKKFSNSLLQFRIEAKALLPSHQGVSAIPSSYLYEPPQNQTLSDLMALQVPLDIAQSAVR